jgi:hypothetical protein
VSASIDRQFKPSLAFYPVHHSRYSEQLSNEFLDRILTELKSWLEQQLSKDETEMVSREMMLVELHDNQFKIHRLRYL